ncbi:MAG: 4Fe-4S binding protein [Desulforhopalus sp.]
MQRKNTSVSAIIAEPPDQFSESPQENTFPSIQLDFFSADFNNIDELDDNRGNYKSFQSLEGVITSDMKHHQKRKEPKVHGDSIAEIPEAEEVESQDLEEPLKERALLPLTIVSRGFLLIIDKNMERAVYCAEFLSDNGLTCTLCVPDCGENVLSVSLAGSFPLVKADSVFTNGSFGGFSATVTGTDGTLENISALIGQSSCGAGHKPGFFDLVLDLQSMSSFTGKLLPVGYYAPGEDKIRLDAALLELPEMKGSFTKPQLTELREDRCLHGRSRFKECLQCMNVCPVGAIRVKNRRLVIDQYLCQACCACALVCPSDAIKLLNPPQKSLLDELSRLLSEPTVSSSGCGNVLPDIFLYDQNIDGDLLKSLGGSTADYSIYVEVEEIGRIGLEVMLVVLAYGAGKVTLVCDMQSPVDVREALKQQVEQGREILQGLNMPVDCINFVLWSQSSRPNASEAETSVQYVNNFPRAASRRSIAQADFSFDHDKRTLIRLAAEHLFSAHGIAEPVISLRAGAPFGVVEIDESCSLCMACAGICPSSALVAGGDEPSLSLVESRCHQCGFCVEVCPENALRLLPRLLCNIEAADTKVLLRKVESFKCIVCGEPFASKSMISRMQEKLHGHWMYQSNQQVKRLQMCRTCRTRDALTLTKN